MNSFGICVGIFDQNRAVSNRPIAGMPGMLNLIFIQNANRNPKITLKIITNTDAATVKKLKKPGVSGGRCWKVNFAQADCTKG